MKINIFLIVVDHIKTLRDLPSQRLSLTDIVTFFIVPLVVSLFAYGLSFSVQDEFYNVSITFFGIFIALLLNIQVAIFSIFLRKWDIPVDLKSQTLAEERINQRRLLLKEINSNVSYLILVSCLALFSCLVAYTESYLKGFFPAFSMLIYSHFFLTLLMIIKRVYAVFQKEYL